MIEYTNYLELPLNLNAHGVDARKLFAGEHLQIIHLELKPGDVIPLHAMDLDVMFFVIEGEGTFLRGEETITLKAGSLVHSPQGIGKGWKNLSDNNFRILAIKTIL